MKGYPPGMIGLACGELGRFSDITPSLIGMHKPDGTLFLKGTGLGPAVPFNGIAREFLKHEHLEWLFLTNDDNLCPFDTIPRLLDRGVDVVSGLYFGRMQPFEPVMFDKVEVRHDDNGTPYNWYTRHLMEYGEGGLYPAVTVGDGCLLIRRHVMEALSDPWWEYGETLTDACDHDVVFSRKVREAGFGLYCDFEVRVDHIAVFAVRPVRTGEGHWQAHLVQDNRAISLPAPPPKPKIASRMNETDEGGTALAKEDFKYSFQPIKRK